VRFACSRLIVGGAAGLLPPGRRGRPGGRLWPGSALDRSPVLAGSWLRQLPGADGPLPLSHDRRHRPAPANARLPRCGRTAQSGAAAAGGGSVSAAASLSSVRREWSSTASGMPAPGRCRPAGDRIPGQASAPLPGEPPCRRRCSGAAAPRRRRHRDR
jgi:hypothetical protein